MDIRVTKERLNDHLSYDWWKYIAILVASIFLWSLLFTMTSPRLAPPQKMEMIFVVNGYNYEGAERMRGGLSQYLSQDFVEINFNNYSAGDDYTMSQVISARLSVKEGDLYVFPYTDELTDNRFAVYVDNGVFADLETLISKAKAYGSDVMSKEQFKKENAGKREYSTPDRLEKGYNSYVEIKNRAVQEAQKLEGYIDQYGNVSGEPLFVKYARYSASKEFYPDDEWPEEEEKFWGINYNAFAESLNNFNSYGFIYSGIDSNTGSIYPTKYAMGIVAFESENMPMYYENLAVINFFIETYYLPLLEAND